MKYILDYLREQVGIQPVAGAMVRYNEEFEGDVPIGHRLVINDRETDIVVWYADLNEWLKKKYEDLIIRYNIILQSGYDKKMD